MGLCRYEKIPCLLPSCLLQTSKTELAARLNSRLGENDEVEKLIKKQENDHEYFVHNAKIKMQDLQGAACLKTASVADGSIRCAGMEISITISGWRALLMGRYDALVWKYQ